MLEFLLRGRQLRTFVAVSADHLSGSIGLPPDEIGLPDRYSVAEAIRKYVGVRRSADLGEVAAWFDALASSAGYAGLKTRARFHSVCRQLAAAGDFALMSSGGKNYLLAVEPKTVTLGLEYDVLLGDLEGTGCLIEADTVVRKTMAQDQSVELFEHIPSPPWPSITDRLGLAEGVRPARILDELREASSHSSIRIRAGSEPEELVELGSPEVRLCVGSEEEGQVPAVCFREKSGHEVCLWLGGLDDLAWLYLSHVGPAGVAAWPDRLRMPDRLLSILTLLGSPDDDSLSKWSLGETAVEIFSEWLGVPRSDGMPASEDKAQAEVIEAPIDARLLIVAGPGSGKTWTACSRIAKLIEAGAVPSRILVVSFTRAAVSEIRNRIGGFLDRTEDAYGINIQTLDSLAWSLTSGAGSAGDISSTDFEAGIKRALKLLDADEDWLLDELERYQHVVIDEAQDLTGDRRSMVLALLQRLRRECGISVFHDPAQSIYHFVERERAGIESGMSAIEPAFRTVELRRNYRCKSQKLLDLFAEGRRLLDADDVSATEISERIRKEIEAAAEPAIDRESRSDERDTFHLFRWRSQLTFAINQALRAGRPVRTRLPHHRTLIQPWISAALQSAIGGSISEKEFFEIYTGLHPFPGRSSHQAWGTLRRVSGDERGGVDLARLAEVMKSKAPVAEIAISDIGPRSAPLFSTIHAAKGREAEIVVLGLAGTTQAQAEEEILEEARVLYVGATRAAKQLRIGAYQKGMKTLTGARRRHWRAWNGGSDPAAYVELGLPGDVEPTAPATGVAELDDVNFLLWQRSQKTSKAMLKMKGGRYQISLDSDGEGLVLGSLSAAFTSDLKAIGKQLTGGSVFPSARIEGVFIVGSSSVVTAGNPNALRFSFAPILAGTPLIFFSRT